jgi:hypothetical protein
MDTHDWVFLAGAAMVCICVIGASRHLSQLLCMAIDALDEILTKIRDLDEIVTEIHKEQ